MAKNPTHSVDESKLMAMMAGQSPTEPTQQAAPEAEREVVVLEHGTEIAQVTASGTLIRKKAESYEEAFLAEGRLRARKPLTVDAETHYKIERVMRLVFDNKIPMSIFVDNILSHHLSKYDGLYKQLLEEKPKSLY